MGSLSLTDGRNTNVVLVGPRENPKGAALVLPGEGGGALRTQPLSEAGVLIGPGEMIDILAMQERVFGKLGLGSPFDGQESS